MALFGKLVKLAIAAAAIGGGAFWWLSAPDPFTTAELAGIDDGDAERGRTVFWAGGCASCHAAPGAAGEARLALVGGVELATPFGTFVAPNISQHPQDGIGGWSATDLANAMLRGVSPDGAHYYPAFPYSSYARMTVADVGDLHAFMKTLPAVAGAAAEHQLGFPFNIRRGLGLWKLLYRDGQPVVALGDASDPVKRGQYLVEGPGHCGECHTPRNAIGGPEKDRWLSGAVAAEGQGTVPNITSGQGGLDDWSETDIATLLETGFTPEFDSAGGAMASVVRNMAELPQDDRAAIAAYLKAIPGHPNGY